MNHQEIGIILNNLSSGRWGVPLTLISLNETFQPDRANYWKSIFEEFNKNGFSREQIILFLNLMVSNQNKVTSSPTFELVWTGPEALNSTLRDTSIVAQDLFREASREVMIAGFAFYQGKKIFKELAQKYDNDPEFKVSIFVDVRRDGNTSIAEAIVLQFKTKFLRTQWPGNRIPDIYYAPETLRLDSPTKTSMHAKCVLIDDKKSLITSANFTQAAHHRNIEAGVVIDSNDYTIRLKSQFMNLVESGYFRNMMT